MNKLNYEVKIKLIVELVIAILKDANLLDMFEGIFEKELKPLFQGEDIGQLIEISTHYLNKNIYGTLVKKDPMFKRNFPTFEEFEENGTDYQYHPSESGIEEIKSILGKLLK